MSHTADMFLLRRRLFWARCLLDIYDKFMLCLVLIDRSCWVMNLLVNVEITTSPPARTTVIPRLDPALSTIDQTEVNCCSHMDIVGDATLVMWSEFEEPQRGTYGEAARPCESSPCHVLSPIPPPPARISAVSTLLKAPFLLLEVTEDKCSNSIQATERSMDHSDHGCRWNHPVLHFRARNMAAEAPEVENRSH